MSLFSSVQGALSQARWGAQELLDKTAMKKQQVKGTARELAHDTQYVDLTIRFLGASGLPKLDAVGSADPYFRASIDGRLQYTSNVKENTLTPVWNETWHIKNVPATADLEVRVYDKDAGPLDDTIGMFHASVADGAREFAIESLMTKRKKGTFWLEMDVNDPTHAAEHCPPYTFDGPVRFSRHFSPTVGLLTSLNEERLYSTWKIFIKGVAMIFGDTVQGWNRDYPAAQRIFGPGPESFALRSAIKSGHAMLYARTTCNGFGVIETKRDVLNLFEGSLRGYGPPHPPHRPYSPPAQPPASGANSNDYQQQQLQLQLQLSQPAPPPKPPQRIKPAVYTYVIAVPDSSLRFSETGAAFLVDFASKHALHANCAEAVRYSGEFHPRPVGGWQGFSDDLADDDVEWELVVDNNSGTYSPNKDDLVRTQMVFEYNLPGIAVRALDREDPALKESVAACREYALKFRGTQRHELQPHVQVEGEKTMQQMAISRESTSSGARVS
ncbi:unnamed protein product [Discula destructiva]